MPSEKRNVPKDHAISTENQKVDRKKYGKGYALAFRKKDKK